jgi:hypothetical protein
MPWVIGGKIIDSTIKRRVKKHITKRLDELRGHAGITREMLLEGISDEIDREWAEIEIDAMFATIKLNQGRARKGTA